MLRIAVPNKGSLSEAASSMLREAGYRQRHDSHDLAVVDPENDVEFFYLRPRDIAVYVGEGTLDVGLTGRDLMLDSGAPVSELMTLGFGEAAFAFAGPAGRFATADDLAGARVATAYPGLVRDYLKDRGVDAHVVRLDGAVETAVRLGVADAIADVISTGTTLRQAGLVPFGEPLMRSEAVLVGRKDAVQTPDLEVFLRRMQGVLVARLYVMLDYDVPASYVDQACEITPGIESPTVSPLQREGWFAVRAMVPRGDAQSVMDRLYDLGARGILVTTIHACRL
ncbi:MAG: ATP phosphoribosyltransferase [Actinomycetota bacterium]|nr:ATP phosphoribosyltransferase [Actinomycetota bacterium]